MAMNVHHALDARQINAVALGLDDHESWHALRATRERERAAWQRTRDRLAAHLLKEVWSAGQAVDAGIWGPALCHAEAERLLQEAARRGMLYLDPVATREDSNAYAPLVSRLRGVLHRFFRKRTITNAKPEEDKTAW